MWKGREYRAMGIEAHGYDKYEQEELEEGPMAELERQGREIKAAVRNGGMDLAELHDRYVEIWMEGRMVVWRAKRAKSMQRVKDPETGALVESYGPSEHLVLQGLGVLKGVVDSMVKVRGMMEEERPGIPRWAIERIEKALRNHPEAMRELLKELAAGEEKEVEKI